MWCDESEGCRGAASWNARISPEKGSGVRRCAACMCLVMDSFGLRESVFLPRRLLTSVYFFFASPRVETTTADETEDLDERK